MVDRENRYGKKEKGGDTSSKETGEAKDKARETAGDRKGEGGDGADKKTPEAKPTDEPKSEFGEVASRQETERGDMHKRHEKEMHDMHERHSMEHRDMHKRHAKEIAAAMDKQPMADAGGAAPAGEGPGLGAQEAA